MTQNKNHVQQTKALRIKQLFNYRCAKCGRKKGLEIHHILPFYKGGNESDSNLIPLCRECHRFVPDETHDLIKYLSSPYCPQIDVMRHTARVSCKYFHDLPEEELKRFRETTAEDYFEKTLEPVFLGIRKLIFGFDELDEEEMK